MLSNLKIYNPIYSTRYIIVTYVCTHIIIPGLDGIIRQVKVDFQDKILKLGKSNIYQGSLNFSIPDTSSSRRTFPEMIPTL